MTDNNLTIRSTLFHDPRSIQEVLNLALSRQVRAGSLPTSIPSLLQFIRGRFFESLSNLKILFVFLEEVNLYAPKGVVS